MPGLDGLRAIAVLAVIAYHLGIGWMPGGLLGVGVFFTLSGYLITDLLLAQVDSGGIKLGSFWLARARRLLPALIVMLVVVMAWVTVIGPHQPPDFRQAVLSAAVYVNNWWQIFHDVSYFAQFSAPAPLNHLWSLSVEEQFYIVWPFALMLAIRYLPRMEPRAGTRPRLGAIIFALAIASGILMAILYQPQSDPSRVYYGTDTRAIELLVGAALAAVWPSRRLRSNISSEARRLIDAAGIIGLGVIALMFLRSTELSPFLYRGGFLILSLATALLVAALAHPASRLGPLLGGQPLRWIGERSYGIYLWHFPIIALTSPEGAEGPGLVRGVLQVAATIGVAALSWKYVEDPIRRWGLRRALGRWWQSLPRPLVITRRGWAMAGATAVTVFAAILGLAGVGAGPSQAGVPHTVAVATTVTEAEPVGDADRTSCDELVHIGDSTSEGLVSEQYVTDPGQLIAARYARVGVKTAHFEVALARSIYESGDGLPNAEDVATSWRDQGFHGCWVFALGTNDSANVAAGSAVGLDERIETMMSVAGEDPALWVNLRTLNAGGFAAEPNMLRWNEALEDACAEHPTMRVYDWASDAEDKWFGEDGVHFSAEGNAARARLIANALREAFPEGGDPALPPESGCLVSAGDDTSSGTAG
jgi:peptidoglycan/LPS O-acetylase OafA/YrhL